MPTPLPQDSSPQEQPATASRRRLVLGLVATGWFLLINVPGVFAPIGPAGIDTSWIWAVNHAHAAGSISYGRDLAFTYGPLSFLMVPLDVGNNLVLGNLFWLAVHLVLGTALVVIFLHRQQVAPLLTGLLLLALSRFALYEEGRILLALVLLVLAALLGRGRESSLILWPLAAVFAAILVFIKASLGFGALSVLAIGLLLGRQESVPRPPWWLVAAAGVTVLILVVETSFGSLGVATEWLRSSYDITSGYSVAMSSRGEGWRDLVLGLLVLAAWLLVALLTRGDRQLAMVSTLLLLPVLLHFRLAFVSEGMAVLQFFGFVLAAIGLWAVLGTQPRQVAGACLVFAFVLVPASMVDSRTASEQLRQTIRRLGGHYAVANITRLVRLPATRQELARQSRENLRSLALPPAWLSLLRSSRNGVGTLPTEILYCPANDLVWNPTPTMHLFVAYSSRLDRWSAGHYAGERAPQYIVLEQTRLGMRHPLFDTPAVWRELLLRYCPRARLDRRRLLLLERRPQALPATYRQVARSEVLFGSRLPVPASRFPIHAEIDLRLSWAGRIQKTVFRVPPLYLILRHTGGRQGVVRLVPDTARNGLLVNHFPGNDWGELVSLWRHGVADPVVEISIAGPGQYYFREPIAVNFKELRIGQQEQGWAPETG